ncbi:hypothetical protein DICSQDRAFT_169002 [Dichomitus squalens LYAD-421 SS1]|uniref:uncharacterized protein n=1 Tax=Dichomitus squalens (strain LYAD-421) TaxID=732165 RepID=UPI0004414A46|nr:uncharacterized protein DICSQDRAFT_169002 [Dichomitus squalens LYAD-421 SS1]EJF62610.1 hypothetical protein DICSQDRAFT_169002 [Dichomitus squalens LYAD-421 SS1]
MAPTGKAPSVDPLSQSLPTELTSWSDAEETLVKTANAGEVPNNVEAALRDEGADMLTGTDKKLAGTTVDREVVSGANPMAANALGAKFVEMLKAR